MEAFRYLIHEAATVRAAEPTGSHVLMINDVSRAIVEAPATRDFCIEIPQEYMTDADRRHDQVGRLRMSLFGTRDAAMHWQSDVAREMIKAGLRRGKYNPCLYLHEKRNLITFLHCDDFATVGTKENVKWFKETLENGLRSKPNA